MSKDRGKPLRPKQAKKPAPSARRQPAGVQPLSPLGLVGAIGAALIIAAILLFVINARINASKPATPAATATPVLRPSTATPGGAAPTIATNTQAPQPTAPGATLTGGFSKGNAQAKVTFTEFADFK